MLVSTTIYFIFLHSALSLARLLCNRNKKIQYVITEWKCSDGAKERTKDKGKS